MHIFLDAIFIVEHAYMQGESSAYISVLQFETNGLSQTNCKANSISMKEICPNEFNKKNVKKNIAHNLNIIFNVNKTIRSGDAYIFRCDIYC
jgi:hypothetical protein